MTMMISLSTCTDTSNISTSAKDRFVHTSVFFASLHSYIACSPPWLVLEPEVDDMNLVFVVSFSTKWFSGGRGLHTRVKVLCDVRCVA